MTTTPPGDGWRRTELCLATDLGHGGRWTSLASQDREWLWRNPDDRVVDRRMHVRPGDAFVDAGGAEECFPTIRGHPDHGDVWPRPWTGSRVYASVDLGCLRLERHVEVDGAVHVGYRITAAPGERFLHAVHILLDLSTEARVIAPEVTRMRVLDHPLKDAVSEVAWPDGLGVPLDRLGPDDGTATGACLLDCHEVTVLDGNDALTLVWSAQEPAHQGLLSMFLWRNLQGWPADGPYRSIGIEPMVGRAADLARASDEDLGVAGEGDDLCWSLQITSWRRSLSRSSLLVLASDPTT